jgi:hypothetical protein
VGQVAAEQPLNVANHRSVSLSSVAIATG